MKMKTMRWGYDGGGICCGPMEGNTIVEIQITDDTGHDYFLNASRMAEFEKMIVSESSLFDLMMEANEDRAANWDVNYAKVEAAAIETYDFEISYDEDDTESVEFPEEMKQSRFQNALMRLHSIMTEYYYMDEEEAGSAEDYLAKIDPEI